MHPPSQDLHLLSAAVWVQLGFSLGSVPLLHFSTSNEWITTLTRRESKATAGTYTNSKCCGAGTHCLSKTLMDPLTQLTDKGLSISQVRSTAGQKAPHGAAPSFRGFPALGQVMWDFRESVGRHNYKFSLVQNILKSMYRCFFFTVCTDFWNTSHEKALKQASCKAEGVVSRDGAEQALHTAVGPGEASPGKAWSWATKSHRRCRGDLRSRCEPQHSEKATWLQDVVSATALPAHNLLSSA